MEVGGEGDYNYTYRYTVTTRMTLRWAAMRAILMFHNCEGQSQKTVSATTASEEKGKPKRIRTEVPLPTSLTLMLIHSLFTNQEQIKNGS